jgi:hypothetical protein
MSGGGVLLPLRSSSAAHRSRPTLSEPVMREAMQLASRWPRISTATQTFRYKDQAGAVVEYTLDKATNALSDVRLISGGK